MEPQNPEEDDPGKHGSPFGRRPLAPCWWAGSWRNFGWEPVKMDDPRLTAHPDWLKEFRILPGVTAAVLPCISRLA